MIVDSNNNHEVSIESINGSTDTLLGINESDTSLVDPYNRIVVNAIDDLDSSYQKYTNPHIKDLLGFLHDTRKTYLTKKGDKEVNIMNQKYGKNYVIPDNDIPEFFARYEKCRVNKCALNYAEKQGSDSKPCSGIMLDYDCKIDSEHFDLSELVAHQMVNYIVRRHLMKHLIFPNNMVDIHVFFIVRPETKKLETYYKTGFHILIPGVQVLRSYKKYLVNSLKDDPIINKLLKSAGVKNLDDALDLNSASVPTCFLGSCKPNGLVYDLPYGFHVTVELDDDPMPIIRRIEPPILRKYNLSWELSLNYETKYSGDIPPLVKKQIYKIQPKIESEVVSFAERNQGNLINKGHLEDTFYEVQELRRTKPQADMLCKLLDLLPEETYDTYSPWRNIVFGIANTSESYFPIVKWFSQRCPQKYSEAELKALWEDAIRMRYENSVRNPITFATIKYMAKVANEERYKQLVSQDAVNLLAGWAWKYDGKLDHYNIAKLLYLLFAHKFKVDVDPAGKGFLWYQFIMPGDRMEQGEIWKWRERRVPLELYEYISEGLEGLCDHVKESMRQKLNEAEDEAKGKKINSILNSFSNSSRNIFNNTFKKGVIKEAEQLFIHHGFSKSLDRNGDLFGCGNGIILLGNKCKIINRFHEHTINKFSPVKAIPFDPTNPMTKKALDMFRLAIPEKDARIKLMMFWASCLDGWAKDPELAILTGVGGNAKTTTVQCINKCFGEYGIVMNAQLLTKDAAAADKPNSQIAAMECSRMIMMEETNRDEALNPSMVKKLVNPGDISNRDLHSKQKTFKITSKITLITNHKPKLDIKDGGLKRRLFHYRYKCRFVPNPEPGTYQRKDDPRFIKEYPDNPEFQSALLSILVYFYEILQTLYSGNLKRVPSPTIDRETEEFFNEHDHFGQFVKERIVYCPNEKHEYPLTNIAVSFKTWLSEVEEVHKRAQQSNNDTVKDIEDSIMLSKYIETACNNVRVLKNCRILEKNDSIRVGESYISHVKNHELNPDNRVIEDVDDDWWVIPEYERYLRDQASDEETKEDPTSSTNDDISMMHVERTHKKKEINDDVNSFLQTL
jgi:phage/plasmid-associated DNA primase